VVIRWFETQITNTRHSSRSWHVMGVRLLSLLMVVIIFSYWWLDSYSLCTEFLSCPHTTVAALSSQELSQIVPHCSFWHISTRPSYGVEPPASLMSPSRHAVIGKKSLIMLHWIGMFVKPQKLLSVHWNSHILPVALWDICEPTQAPMGLLEYLWSSSSACGSIEMLVCWIPRFEYWVIALAVSWAQSTCTL